MQHRCQLRMTVWAVSGWFALALGAINLCEVFYDFHRALGMEVAWGAIGDLRAVGVLERSDMTPEFWQSAGIIKSIHRRISLADCFAIALANKLDGQIATADHHEFDPLAQQGVCAVRFIR